MMHGQAKAWTPTRTLPPLGRHTRVNHDAYDVARLFLAELTITILSEKD